MQPAISLVPPLRRTVQLVRTVFAFLARGERAGFPARARVLGGAEGAAEGAGVGWVVAGGRGGEEGEGLVLDSGCVELVGCGWGVGAGEEGEGWVGFGGGHFGWLEGVIQVLWVVVEEKVGRKGPSVAAVGFGWKKPQGVAGIDDVTLRFFIWTLLICFRTLGSLIFTRFRTVSENSS